MATNILFVLSGADHWTHSDGSTRVAGFIPEELGAPHEVFARSGANISFASPEGRRPNLDPVGRESSPASPNGQYYGQYCDSIAQEWQSPQKLDAVNAADYDAIMIPGGYAPMEDLHQDAAMGRLLSDAAESGTVIAAVCHGPAALLSATDPDGNWLFAGRRVTALDNEEEKLYGTIEKAPFLLESRLVELGARFEHGPPWLPYVVADDRLITRQNPASAGAVANAIITMCNGHGG